MVRCLLRLKAQPSEDHLHFCRSSVVLGLLIVAGISPSADALCYAARWGCCDVVRALVTEFRLPVNSRDNDGQTPLHHAVEARDLPCIRLLLELKADPSIHDKEGRTVVDDVFVFSLPTLKTLRFLVEELKADPHKLDHEGGTLLHRDWDDVEYLRYLVLTVKLDPHAKDKQGRTVLHCISDPDCIRFLCNECKLDINTRDNHGRTPLHCMLRRNLDVATLRWLVTEAKADVTAVDNDGEGMLRCAAQSGSLQREVVGYLITECKAEVEARTNTGHCSRLGLQVGTD